MSSVVRVRVEAKRLPMNSTRQERERSCTSLLRAFKRACNEYGIMPTLKEHEHFVRNTDKKRRKKMMKQIAINNPESLDDQQQFRMY
jgi:ribosomal protein S21